MIFFLNFYLSLFLSLNLTTLPLLKLLHIPRKLSTCPEYNLTEIAQLKVTRTGNTFEQSTLCPYLHTLSITKHPSL